MSVPELLYYNNETLSLFRFQIIVRKVMEITSKVRDSSNIQNTEILVVTSLVMYACYHYLTVLTSVRNVLGNGCYSRF